MAFGSCAFLTVALVVTLASHVSCAHYDDESSLRTAVLSGYEYKIRPATTVTVSVRFSLLHINHLDVPGQLLSVAGWLTFEWTDSRLVWTPATYNNIEDFYDTELVLWRPEIIVDNSITTLDILESDKLLIRATYDGTMVWEPPGIFETHCDVDVTYYPFDTQVCIVEVTGWSYTLNELDLSAAESTVYLEDFQESGEWDILDTWTERKILVDNTDQHSQIDFYIKLRRKPVYYILTILIPVIVTSLLCTIVFILPADSGEKVGYSLTVLLTYTVMLTLVASYMPPTSKSTSVLSVYLTIILFVGVFTTIMTVFVLYCHHQSEDREIPKWLLNITNGCMIPMICWHRRRGKSADDLTNDHTNTKNRIGTPVAPMDHRSSSVSQNQRDSSRSMYHSNNSNDRIFTLPRANIPNDKNGKEGDEGQRGFNREPPTPRPHQFGNSKIRYEVESWQEVSKILDAVCLRVLGLFVILITIIVLLVLVIGGYTV